MKNPIVDKMYNEFFYQSEYILKDDGALAIITQNPDIMLKHATKYDFKLSSQKEVYTGEQKLFIMVFSKDLSAIAKKSKEKKQKAKKDKEVSDAKAFEEKQTKDKIKNIQKSKKKKSSAKK